MTRITLLILAALGLAACDETVTSNAIAPDLTEVIGIPPDGADPNACWTQTVSPATIETVTQKVLVTPARISPDGRVQTPPVYRNETRQIVATPRREEWFETPCAQDMTPEFIASVQRALVARGYLTGEATGVLDAPTRRAIETYQSRAGINAEMLTVAAARKLGLWAVDLSIEG